MRADDIRSYHSAPRWDRAIGSLLRELSADRLTEGVYLAIILVQKLPPSFSAVETAEKSTSLGEGGFGNLIGSHRTSFLFPLDFFFSIRYYIVG